MNILLVQTAFLGDVILSTPLITNIKRLHPGAKLWVLTTPAGREILSRDPRLEGILVFDKRGKDARLDGLFRKAAELCSYTFDRVYSLHKSWRTGLLLWLAGIPMRIGFRQAKLHFLYTQVVSRREAEHEVLRGLSLLSPEDDGKLDDSLTLYVDERMSSDKVAAVLATSKSYVAVFPGSAWHTKRWSAAGFRAVVRSITENGGSVVLLGAKNERSLCDQIAEGTDATVLAGETTLGETMALVKHAKSVLANDSMALHLASSFKTPAVAVFCATSPLFGFGPWKNKSIIIEKAGLSCKPCAPHGGKTCPVGTEACMTGIDPQTVIEALEKIS